MDPNQPLSAEPVREDELHALVDARLSVDERLAVEARLARDPAAAATRAAWQLQRDALRDLYRPLQEQPLPAPLAAAARHAAQAQHALGQWSRWGGMAAAVVLAFGLGWLSHRQLEYGIGAGAVSSAGPAARVASAREFASQATLAHAVYAPELRHPVEVTAAQQEHLVQWLSKRLERPLKVPKLSALGYELVGGRLLPGAAGARAQFMYQNAAGERVTLYLGATRKQAAPAAAPAPAPAPDARETAFSFADDGPVPGFYWVDQGFGYALSGPLSRERLLALAQSVYAQL